MYTTLNFEISTMNEINRSVLYHEAGHAIIARRLGIEIKKIVIGYDEEEDCEGYVETATSFYSVNIFISFASRRYMNSFLNEVRCYVAGYASQLVFAPKRAEKKQSARDFEKAGLFCAYALVTRPIYAHREEVPEVEVILEEVKEMLREPKTRAELFKLARALVRRPEMTGEEIDELLR